MPANKPPDNAEQDKPKHGQTSALMHIHPVILDTDHSRNHRYRQSPVENAQWQVPDKEPVICVLSLHDPVDPRHDVAVRVPGCIACSCCL